MPYYGSSQGAVQPTGRDKRSHVLLGELPKNANSHVVGIEAPVLDHLAEALLVRGRCVQRVHGEPRPAPRELVPRLVEPPAALGRVAEQEPECVGVAHGALSDFIDLVADARRFVEYHRLPTPAVVHTGESFAVVLTPRRGVEPP